MDKRIEQLKQLGCGIEDAMERFLDDEEFYLECFDALLQDEKFGALKAFIAARDKKAAFECAHTLKGLFSNLGLTSLNEKIAVLVEKLRSGKWDNVEQDYEAFAMEWEKYRSI